MSEEINGVEMTIEANCREAMSISFVYQVDEQETTKKNPYLLGSVRAINLVRPLSSASTALW